MRQFWNRSNGRDGRLRRLPKTLGTARRSYLLLSGKHHLELQAFVLSWPIKADCAARSSKLYHCMVTYVLIEAIRQRLKDCPVCRLKIDFNNVGNCVSVRRSGDS